MPRRKRSEDEEEVMSEVTERAMEANMKLLVANEISHSNRMTVLAETAVGDAINLSRKANDAYLAQAKQQGDAYMEQAKKQGEETLNFQTQIHHHVIENNRYTLDRLYSVFAEEAVSLSKLLQSLGWAPPPETPVK